MSEAFHQWVNNLTWYEKLYYQIFDPQAITCTTSYTIPLLIYLPCFIVMIISFTIWLYFKYKNEFIEDEID